ncbi:hypothetical protein FACS1894184_14190 [Clostridia bacterium]|nr:hypothetical protein FACS1894184_14190 [Clostridia bacterium]
MAVTLTSYITNAGIVVMNRLLATQGPLHFTRAQLGTGTVASADAARSRTSLISPNNNAVPALARIEYSGGAALVDIQYKNIGLAQGFFVKEIGLFCEDPNNPAAEVLYTYVAVGDPGDWIAPATSAVYVRSYTIETIVDTIQTVTITVTPGLMVSKEDFDAEKALVRDIIDDTTGTIYQYARARLDQNEADYIAKFAQIDDNASFRDQVVDASIGTLYQYTRSGFSAIDTAYEVKSLTLTNTVEYPFNNSARTVALSTNRLKNDYSVYPEVKSGPLNPGDVVITDRLLNGFKVAYTGSAPSIDINLYVQGGMTT